MAKHDDANGVTWDIKTTSVQIDQGTPTESYAATVDDDSSASYVNNRVAVDEETIPATVHLVWPAKGLPILTGKTASVTPEAAIDSFAARNAFSLVQGKPKPSSSGLPFLAWVAIVYVGYRVIKKATSGRGYRG